MKHTHRRMFSRFWVNRIFAAQAAQTGGVIRRSIAWIEREIGRDYFDAEVRDRGYHMIEYGGQLVVICNATGLWPRQ